MKIFSFTMGIMWLGMLMFVVLYIMGWLDFDNNNAISECLRAGKDWTGSSCK